MQRKANSMTAKTWHFLRQGHNSLRAHVGRGPLHWYGNVCMCVHVTGGDGHQPYGLLTAQQPGQLLQLANGQQGARGGGEQ